MLKFSKNNAKLGDSIWTFSLPAGHSCPFAFHCLSKANPLTGKIQDGPQTQFRCFAASQEALFTATRAARWHNFNLLKMAKTVAEISKLIQDSLPKNATIVRIHVAGDFYSQNYLDGWIDVAKRNPNVIFYAYTKSLPFWIKRQAEIPANFKLTASKGGKADKLIGEKKLKFAEVVYSEKEAKQKKLAVDHDDTHAYNGDKSFALLLHGTQPAGTIAAKAMSAMRTMGINGCSRKKKNA